MSNTPESERDSLLRERETWQDAYRELKEECDSLRQRVTALETACAGMRDALGALLELYYDCHPHGRLLKKATDEELRKRMEWLAPSIFRVGPILAARAALSSSAGKATLERIKGLEGFLAEVRGRYEAALAEGIDRVIMQAAEGGGAGKTLADIVTRRFMTAIAFEPEFYLKEAGKDA